MAKELSEGIRGQLIALSNEGFSQHKIAEKIGSFQRVLCSKLWKGFKKQNPILQNQDLGGQELPL